MRETVFSGFLGLALLFPPMTRLVEARCSDYIGFWIADYDKPDHRDYIEFYFDGNLNRESRETYYKKTGEPFLIRGQDYGRLRDSVGKCFGIIDTAEQVDSNRAPAGRVHFGEWFEFDYAVKNINGQKMIHEVTADTLDSGNGTVTVIHDTLRILYASDRPVFLNKFLFGNPSVILDKADGGAEISFRPWDEYRVDGRRGSHRRKGWHPF
jgi:hypothetical protein